MKVRVFTFVLASFLIVGCSKKAADSAPGADSSAAHRSMEAPATTHTTSTESDDDDMGMTSGMAGMATGSAAAAAVATSEAAAVTMSTPAETDAEKLARTYLGTTTIGKAHPYDIKLVKAKKGSCETCWYFTYHVGGTHEITIQTADKIASVFGTMKELK